MKKIFGLVAVLFSALAFAQSVNDYQYVVVPTKFDFSKQANPFGLSTLTKALLEKYQFKAFLDSDEIPEDILRYNCNKLYADLLEDNTIVSTKLTIVLKDCKGKVVYQTAQGVSRTKDWRVGYNEALRDAAKSMDQMRYKYNGANAAGMGETVVKTVDGQVGVLFAQPVANGFQLVDNTPKIVMQLRKTGSSNVFLAQKGSQQGVLRQENAQWLFEYYQGDQLVSEALQIKF